MYPFFGFNRTRMYEESTLVPQKQKKVLKQVQAGTFHSCQTDRIVHDVIVAMMSFTALYRV